MTGRIVEAHLPSRANSHAGGEIRVEFRDDRIPFHADALTFPLAAALGKRVKFNTTRQSGLHFATNIRLEEAQCPAQ